MDNASFAESLLTSLTRLITRHNQHYYSHIFPVLRVQHYNYATLLADTLHDNNNLTVDQMTTNLSYSVIVKLVPYGGKSMHKNRLGYEMFLLLQHQD